MRLGNVLGSIAMSFVLSAPLAAAETKQVSVNGTQLTYIEQGEGVPVVFVHGALGDYRTWRGEMNDFAAHYHVIAYSLRFHYPNTSTEGQYSFQTHIDDLVGLLHALNLRPAHLIGHSNGGVVAANVAKDHPELIRSLVLAEPALNSLVAGNEAAKLALASVSRMNKEASQLVQEGHFDQAAVTLMDTINEPNGGFKGLPEFFQKQMLQNASTLKPAFAAPPPPPFSCDDAKRIEAPTLLVIGQRTQEIRHLVTDALEHCLPHTSLVEIPGVGHPLEMLDPKDFNATVLRFLESH